MSTVKIFTGNGPTRLNRFRNSESLNVYLNSSFRGKVITISGVDIYPSQEYFDFILPKGEKAFDSCYIAVQNGDNYDFCAFVDRVEYNTFNDSYWRIYFSVDWWDTYLVRGINLSSYMHGDNVRGHVNDWKKVRGSYIEPIVDNTTFDAEEDIAEVKTYVQIVNQPYIKAGAPNDTNIIQFLYILYTETTANNPKHSVFQTPFSGIPTQFSVAVVPIYAGRFMHYFFAATSGTPGLEQNREIESYPATSLTGDDIIAMFISDFLPLNYGVTYADNNYTLLIRPDQSGITYYSKSFDIDGATNKCTAITSWNFPVINFDAENLLQYGNTNKILPYRAGLVRDRNTFSTYEEYLNFGITKLHCAPYVVNAICTSEKTVIIPFIFVTADENAQITISPNTGGYYINLPIADKAGLGNFITLELHTLFGVYDKQNLYTQINSVVTGITQMASPAAQGIQPKRTRQQQVSTGVSYGTNIAGGISSGINTFRQLALGVDRQLSPTYEGSVTGNAQLRAVTIEPLRQSNIDLIKEHLALYGYTTFLDIDDILLNHKRDVFNYVQAENVICDYPSLPQESRNDIENMFENGVFLFNYKASDTMDFNKKVVNMPQLVV